MNIPSSNSHLAFLLNGSIIFPSVHYNHAWMNSSPTGLIEIFYLWNIYSSSATDMPLLENPKGSLMWCYPTAFHILKPWTIFDGSSAFRNDFSSQGQETALTFYPLLRPIGGHWQLREEVSLTQESLSRLFTLGDKVTSSLHLRILISKTIHI